MTRRAQHQRNVPASKQLAAIDDLLPDHMAYFTLDTDRGSIIMHSDWLERQFGYRRREISISRWLDMMPAQDRQRVARVIDSTRQQGRHAVLRYRMADVRGVAYEVETRIVRVNEAEINGIHLIIQQASLAEPGHHSLANQLASIVGFAELLDRAELSTRDRGFLDELLATARRASRQVGAVGAGWLEQVASELSVSACGLESPAAVDIDPAQLVDIIRPIQQRRSAAAGPRTRFELEVLDETTARTCSTCGANLLRVHSIRLSDDGTALSRHDIAHFFSAGFDTSAIHAVHTGADAVCMAIERLHRLGGHINLESRDRSTSITFHFPVSAPAGTSSAQTAETILLVDDEPAVLGYLKATLEAAGYPVIVARTASEAHQQVETAAEPIALVISDLGLPDEPGDELIRKLHRHSPGIRSLLLTGSAGPLRIQRKGHAELFKPVEDRRLLSIVQSLLAVVP